MKCEEARKTLPLFLYGELSFEEEERLELHIDECAGCRIALEREKALFKSLDAAELMPSRRTAGKIAARSCASRLRTCRAGDSSFWDKICGRASPFISTSRPAGRSRSARVAMLALGFLGRAHDARFVPGTVACTAGVIADPVTSRVRYVEPVASGQGADRGR